MFIQNAKVVRVQPSRTGVSARTGNPWEVIGLNLYWEDTKQDMTTAKNSLYVTTLNPQIIANVKSLVAGQMVDVEVSFNINERTVRGRDGENIEITDVRATLEGVWLAQAQSNVVGQQAQPMQQPVQQTQPMQGYQQGVPAQPMGYGQAYSNSKPF